MLVLLGVVTLVFFLFNVLPGDPARLVMGQRADKASIENARKEMNLNKPLASRYVLYLNDISPIGWHAQADKEKYDYIIIDSPPSLGLITINSFTASDKLLIPVSTGFFAMTGLVQLQETVEMQ